MGLKGDCRRAGGPIVSSKSSFFKIICVSVGEERSSARQHQHIILNKELVDKGDGGRGDERSSAGGTSDRK